MGAGKSEILLSSIVTKNSSIPFYHNVQGYGKTLIYAKADQVTSGYSLSVHIDGYPATGVTKAGIRDYGVRIVNSGSVTLASGDAGRWTLTDPYDEIGVYAHNATANKSGRITVMVNGKRRQ